MCKPTTEERRMLAAETFFHSYQMSLEISRSEINFETPVNLTDIKILSPTKLLRTSSGGFILGATEPSHFPIQFLCNNVHRPHTTTYEYLGTIDYNEEHRTKITFRNNIWTDKIIVCGKFLALTVVIYGSPKDPDVDCVQKLDRLCNLPFVNVPRRIPDYIDSEPLDFYLNPNSNEEYLNIHLNSNYF